MFLPLFTHDVNLLLVLAGVTDLEDRIPGFEALQLVENVRFLLVHQRGLGPE